ncbi:hypothetical protein TWF106_011298 [Orbilia oligospora]|uniref:Uncharacterized protein n=2 Tax=Orbilia oligospora TaxID=2813651 RepID=A0A6G1MGX9_ORBOL|nr:hypothetical protein TWF106_011298 [Orbilia oligospora]KAF3229607.1 hypothetical protein TWF191_001324 [Orbilia oligospora]KAF3258245.1 hypothetical protein TWF192_000380 [Orbilia oligospora]
MEVHVHQHFTEQTVKVSKYPSSVPKFRRTPHMAFMLYGEVCSINAVFPLNPYWRLFLSDNSAYLKVIDSNLRQLVKNKETRCPIHLLGDFYRPQEGPANNSLAFGISVLYQASVIIQRSGDIPIEKINLSSEHPDIKAIFEKTGFDSRNSLVHAVNRLRGYAGSFVKAGNSLRKFLEWAGRYATSGGPNELLKHIYRARVLTGYPGMIPGIDKSILAVELKTDAKDEFVERFIEAVQLLQEAVVISSDEAVAWSGSIKFPEGVDELLVPEGLWQNRNLMSVMYKIADLFKCWLTPIYSTMQNLQQLTSPPEFQVGLEFESRPEGNTVMGEPKGWEWDQGTDMFQGLLIQKKKSGPSTGTDISEPRIWEDETDPSDLRFGYINHNLNAPVPVAQNPPNNVLAVNEIQEEAGDVGNSESSGSIVLSGEVEQARDTLSMRMEEEE